MNQNTGLIKMYFMRKIGEQFLTFNGKHNGGQVFSNYQFP